MGEASSSVRYQTGNDNDDDTILGYYIRFFNTISQMQMQQIVTKGYF